MNHHRFYIAMLLCLIWFTGTAMAEETSEYWDIQWSVPVLVTIGDMPQLRTDSQDNLVMGYVEQGMSYDTLKLAHYEEGTWSFENVVTAQDIHAFDLELDIFDIPSMAYLYGATDCEIAKRIKEDSWETDFIGEGATDIDLALDGRRRPHLLAANLGNNGLQHIYQDQIQWFNEVIDSNIAPGYGVSLVMENEQVMHVAYGKKSAESLRYARRNEAGNWRVETVTSATSAWYSCPSIELDSADSPHLAFCRSVVQDTTGVLQGADVFYTSKKDGQWEDPQSFYQNMTFSPVPPGYLFQPGTITVDNWDRVWLPRPYQQNLFIKALSQWEKINLAPTQNVDLFSSAYVSIVVDSTGSPHIVFTADEGQTTGIYYLQGEVKKVPHSTDYYPDGVVDEKDLFQISTP